MLYMLDDDNQIHTHMLFYCCCCCIAIGLSNINSAIPKMMGNVLNHKNVIFPESIQFCGNQPEIFMYMIWRYR